MMEYKVCFHISYKNPDGTHRGNGKLHYCGNTLEEAVAKVLRHINPRPQTRPHNGTWIDRICTSMGIQRGRRKGENIKWADYVKSEESKQIIEEGIIAHDNLLADHSRRHGWEFLA